MDGIYLISLGCDKNRVDAEIMVARLQEAGYYMVDNPADAVCAIINTCGFITAAKEEAIENIFDMVREKQEGNLQAVVVSGCLSERYRKELCDLIPEADAVIGIAVNEDIVDVVDRVLKGEKIARFGEPEDLCIEGKRTLSTLPHYAYLKIAEGCSNHCTYCAIPSIRGRYRSRSMEAVLQEAKELVQSGVRELILIAQDTTSYGMDLKNGETLAQLLRLLCDIPDVWKIRVLYAYPERITDELIEVMASESKIAKYLDIPMQHADATVLRRMGRGGNQEMLMELVGRLRQRIPDITIRSTFIVGFPDESEEQFETLCDFLQQVRIDRAGCFAFSAEEGTPAEKLRPQVEDEIKQQRAEQFQILQSRIMEQKQQERIGSTIEVICDGYDFDKEMFLCRGDADAPDIDGCVWLPVVCDLMPGEIYRVKITDADDVDVYAQLVDETGTSV